MVELQKFKSKSKNIKNFKKNSIQTDFAKKTTTYSTSYAVDSLLYLHEFKCHDFNYTLS